MNTAAPDAEPVLAPRHRVLVVDDEDTFRAFLREVLEAGGYDVTEAANGREAMVCLRDPAIHLVVTDLLMPEQEGLETIRALRRDYPGLKIIAASGATEQTFLDLARLMGAHAVMEKPIPRREFLATVRELLGS
jgi:CheY-like chemotaxis protein